MNTIFRLAIGAVQSIALWANAAGSLVVLLLVVVVCGDVVARGVFHAPFLGAVEVVQFSMVLIVFLQLPDVVRAGRLTRSDGFLQLMSRRWPGFVRFIGRLIDSVSCLFMLLISIAMWPEFVEMLETRDYFGVPGVFTVPWWPLKLVLFLSTALCSLLFAIKVIVPQHAAPPSAASESISS